MKMIFMIIGSISLVNDNQICFFIRSLIETHIKMGRTARKIHALIHAFIN